MKPYVQKFSLEFLFCFFIFAFSGFGGQAQTKRALFIGNSYTGNNNLPQMVADLAMSLGDTLIFDASTPGGFTLEGHSSFAGTLSKINAENWDFVVLQEQSQRPSFPDAQVASDVYPFAKKLDSAIKQNDSCTETMFYITWGRKFGDASNCMAWPPVCTYEGMDSLLRLRYLQMAMDNEALLSPVGPLWHFLRDYFSGIELYAADNSHPSLAGSYAAACAFYTMIFGEDPSLLTVDLGLAPLDAAAIRAAAKAVVYDSMSKWDFSPDCAMGSGMRETELELGLVVLPNPSKGLFFMEAAFGDGNEQHVSVFDLGGHLVWQGKLDGEADGQLDLRFLDVGLYVLKVGDRERHLSTIFHVIH